MKVPSQPSAAARWRAAALLALPLIVLLAYSPALNGKFIWDDDHHVWQNLTLRDLPGLAHIWLRPSAVPQYYPLTHTSFWIEYQLWGPDPLPFHIDNLLLHLANSFLLWRLLLRLKIPGALLAAGVFALHPVEVESVAWITERKNLLSTCFSLLAAGAFLDEESRAFPWRTFVLFLAAMLSKTVAAMLPAVFLVLLWLRHQRIGRAAVVRLIPFFVVSIGLGYFTAHTEVQHVGAHGADWSLTALQRLTIAGRALWFYLAKLIWPADLIFSYPRWTIDPRGGWQLLFPAMFLMLLLGAWLLRRRIGRAPVAAIAIFSGVLIPALGFFDTYPMRYSFVADHFQYTASIAVITLLCAAIVHRLPESTALAVLVPLLALLTWRQAHAYAGPEALWRDVLAKNPESWLACEDLAVEFTYKPDATADELNEACLLYARVEQLRPQHEKVHGNWAEALFRLGRYQECLAHYELARHSPGAAVGVIHIGVIDDREGVAYLQLHRPDAARARFAEALRIKPGDPAALAGLKQCDSSTSAPAIAGQGTSSGQGN